MRAKIEETPDGELFINFPQEALDWLDVKLGDDFDIRPTPHGLHFTALKQKEPCKHK